jgi:hypothetical protein
MSDTPVVAGTHLASRRVAPGSEIAAIATANFRGDGSAPIPAFPRKRGKEHSNYAQCWPCRLGAATRSASPHPQARHPLASFPRLRGKVGMGAPRSCVRRNPRHPVCSPLPPSVGGEKEQVLLTAVCCVASSPKTKKGRIAALSLRGMSLARVGCSAAHPIGSASIPSSAARAATGLNPSGASLPPHRGRPANAPS